MENEQKLQHKMTRENELLRRLQKLSAKLLRQRDKEALLQEILLHATQFLGAANGAVALLEDDQRHFRLRYGLGIQAGRVGALIKVSEGLVGEVWRSGTVQVIADYRSWERRINAPELANTTTMIIAPLRVNEKIVGMIEVSWIDVSFPVKGETVAAFEQFSLLASVALENATLFQQAERERVFSDAVLDSVPGMLYLYDSQGKLIRWNKQHEAMTGYSSDEMTGRHIMEWFTGDQAAQRTIATEIEKALQGNFADARVDLRRKDGTPIAMYFTAVGMQMGGEKYITGVGLDITKIKQAEDILKHANVTLERKVEERTQELNAMNQELMAMNSEMTAMNQELGAMNESLLYTNELLSKEVAERQQAEQALQQSLDNQKTMQEYLIQSEKMAALGGLVAGVAHEVNTPVGVGVTAASHLKQITDQFRERFTTGTMRRQDLHEYLQDTAEASDILLKNLERASQLIKSFKQVSVDQSNETPRRFKVKQYLDEILLSMNPRLKKLRHTVSVECAEDLEIDGYPGAFAQIVTNLVMNSLIHAYEPDMAGSIHIVMFREQDSIKMIFSDDGKGIPTDVLPKIFDPFFTTKRGAGGTGLGLFVIYNIVVKQFGGSISCDSEPGQGTIFTIQFPIQGK